MHKYLLLMGLSVCLAAGWTSLAQAVDPAVIIGQWEAADPEASELYRVDFGEDGVFLLDIISYDTAWYRADMEAGKLGIFFSAEDVDATDPEGVEWVSFGLADDILTVTEGEMTLEFTHASRPEQAKNPLCGRWELNMEEDSAYPETPPEGFAVIFNNDGTAGMEELSESIEGTFFVTSENGQVEFTVGDKVYTGQLDPESQTIAVTVDEELYTLQRVP